MERIIAEVDAEGGIVRLVSEGIVQARVSAQAYQRQRDIESGKFPKVGVNCYQTEDEPDRQVEFHPYNEEDSRAQVAALGRIRAERDESAVAGALARVAHDARSGANLMPAIVDAVKAYASVGEITNEMVKVFGRYVEPVRF
jgi:methylmalonyl-CoA mutase N-terminal domain/subunit